MADIVIYTNPENLEDKKRPEFYCWWQLSRMPKNFTDCDKIYFAVKGEVKGYFDTVWITKKRINWNTLSWHPLRKKISCKVFRGFRYRWW